MEDFRHELQGAIWQPDGSVTWRVWAPLSKTVELVTWHGEERDESTMEPNLFGYFVSHRDGVEDGTRYAYKLADDHEYPDPASRWQPEGVHRPSAVFLPERFTWTDHAWRGVRREDLVIYELHVGTFTPEGTLDAMVCRLPELASLGVTALELMPLAQFPGNRNWGYDGVHPYAVQNSYGGPRALQRLVDAAHHCGLAVLLDVVHNHLGPEGCYFARFGPYFTDRYRTPWGEAINFDNADSDAVRQFFVSNARAWVRDFHLDGLRFDAVQTIYDSSAQHILAEIELAIEEEAASQSRILHAIAESDLNDVRLVRPRCEGGYELDAAWSDDFHHAVHSLLSGQQDGYYMDFGRPEDVADAMDRIYVYDGRYSRYRRRRHGNRVGDVDRTQFVFCIQNHDQVGGQPGGNRLVDLVSPEAMRLACGLLMLSPCTPLLFMGEEYGETRPFPFFCSFEDPELIEAVRRGRRAEFAAMAFDWPVELPDPQDPATFARAKLQWSWPDGSPQAQLRQLYADLLAARRQWPPLQDRADTSVRLESANPVDAQSAAVPVLVIERGTGARIVALANLSPRCALMPPVDLGDGVRLLTTEDPRYGGNRDLAEPIERLLPYEMLIVRPSQWHA